MSWRSGFDARESDSYDEPLRIALVNLMPDRALLETERQFTALVSDAASASGIRVRITLHWLDGIARSEPARLMLAQRYRALAVLLDCDHVDAVIVTGTAPRTDAFEDEAFWPHLTRLFDWASRHAGSLLVSCLAAHAAVAYLDGVARRRLPRKCSGVFGVKAADPHPVLRHAPRQWRAPHSRNHTVDEAALRSAGYTIVSRSATAGIDVFARERRGMLLLGLNGHPEYTADTLLREYRRDVAQVLSGASTLYPEIPDAVLAASGERSLRNFRAQIESGRATTMAAFPEPLQIRRDASVGLAGGRNLMAGWLRALQVRRGRAVRSGRPYPIPHARSVAG